MAETLNDLNLPQGAINKIIKDGLPENIILGKDVKAAVSRAASMFILYLTAQSTQFAQKVNRKTILAQDILDALEETEFDDLIEPVEGALNVFRNMKQKKDSKQEDVTDEEVEGDMNSGESEGNES